MAKNKWNSGRTTDGLRPVQDVDYKGLTKLYQRPTYKWDVPYSEWQDEAACRGLDPKLFELERGSGKQTDEQHELIAKGLRICVACPVRQACKNNATEADKYWSIRGGQPPEGLFEDETEVDYVRINIRAGRSISQSPRKLKDTCHKGHNNWKTRASGQRRCVDCGREWEKERSKTRKRLRSK